MKGAAKHNQFILVTRNVGVGAWLDGDVEMAATFLLTIAEAITAGFFAQLD